MTTEEVSRTIGQILAPAVMISACAILLSGLLSRYAAINDRLRAFVRERLDLLAEIGDNPPTPFATNRLEQIGHQVPDLLRRHRLEHNAIMAIYSAILVFVVSMLGLGLAATVRISELAAASLYIFLVGTLMLVIGIVLVILEIRTSLESVTYEVKQVFKLDK